MKSIESFVNGGKLRSVRREILFFYHPVLAKLSCYTTKKDADYAAGLLRSDLLKQSKRYDINELRSYIKARAEDIAERIKIHKRNISIRRAGKTSDFYMLSRIDINAYIQSVVYFKFYDIRGEKFEER
jgi:predicted metal-dependent hydrolase